MDGPIRGFTIEEFARITSGVMFEIRAFSTTSVGYGQLAKEKLDPAHPAFPDVANALKAAERVREVVEQFDQEFHRRRKAGGG
jgi:hypothetical protein